MGVYSILYSSGPLLVGITQPPKIRINPTTNPTTNNNRHQRTNTMDDHEADAVQEIASYLSPVAGKDVLELTLATAVVSITIRGGV